MIFCPAAWVNIKIFNSITTAVPFPNQPPLLHMPFALLRLYHCPAAWVNIKIFLSFTAAVFGWICLSVRSLSFQSCLLLGICQAYLSSAAKSMTCGRRHYGSRHALAFLRQSNLRTFRALKIAKTLIGFSNRLKGYLISKNHGDLNMVSSPVNVTTKLTKTFCIEQVRADRSHSSQEYKKA